MKDIVVSIFGSSEYACVIVSVGGEKRPILQSGRVDVIADLAMDLRNDRELALSAWMGWVGGISG